MAQLKALIADDSVVFRKTLEEVLSEQSQIEVVGAVRNGKLAIEALEAQHIDILILDIEMPIMDGLETLKVMKDKKLKAQVFIFSTQSKSSIEKAVLSMNFDVADLILKPQTTNFREALDSIRSTLLPRLLISKPSQEKKIPTFLPTQAQVLAQPDQIPLPRKIQAIAIASSTGGPAALHSFFEELRDIDLKVPIFITQHMPPVFTKGLAERISTVCGFPADEGHHDEDVQPKVYVAPGDWHMEVVKSQATKISLHQKPLRGNVRPCADYMFESIAEVYKSSVLCFVLTGMGADGAEGSEAIKAAGGRIMVQDEESSVVWGMPGATCEKRTVDWVGSPQMCGLVAKRHLEF